MILHPEARYCEMWPSTRLQGPASIATEETLEGGEQDDLKKTLMQLEITFSRIQEMSVPEEMDWDFHLQHLIGSQDWTSDQCHADDRFLTNFVIGDESSFCMNGKVTTHNVRQYAPKGNPPEFNYDVDFSREKLNVWAALCGNGLLLGPFFFQNNMNGNGY